MNSSGKQKTEVHLATILALEQICDERARCHDGLQQCRTLLISELEATKRELASRVAKLDEEILEARVGLEAAKTALEEQCRLVDDVKDRKTSGPMSP